MHIAISADHAGYELKNHLVEFLESMNHRVMNLGTHSSESVDYPDFARAVAVAVTNKEVERGIIVCGSGVGACVAANKVKGARACLCHDTYSAHQGVEHDDMNILCLGARIIGIALAEELTKAFLSANFTNEERHARRLAKVIAIENEN